MPHLKWSTIVQENAETGWVKQSNDNYDIMFSFWKRVFYGVSCLLEVSMLLEMSKKYPFKKMKNYALSYVQKGPLKNDKELCLICGSLNVANLDKFHQFWRPSTIFGSRSRYASLCKYTNASTKTNIQICICADIEMHPHRQICIWAIIWLLSCLLQINT